MLQNLLAAYLLGEHPHPSSAIPVASPMQPTYVSPPSAAETSLAPASAVQSFCGTPVSPHPPLPQAVNRSTTLLPIFA
jgi:hypothetical protein